MRIIAILATYNEERFIATCLEHLFAQGVEVYLIDNCSTDKTVAIAERHLGQGLVGIESFPRIAATYEWRSILERKEELATTLDAHWFMHVDADEIRLPPRSDRTLAQMFAEVEAQNYNAVNFMEFTFIPVREDPDHDHPRFLQTMRHYYPFAPVFPNRLNAWRRQPERVELAWAAGHVVRFPSLRMYPQSFKMRHYLFLSVPHFVGKYAQRTFAQEELQRGWHRWRARIDPAKIELPPRAELRTYTSDDQLDPSKPRTQHIAEQWASL